LLVTKGRRRGYDPRVFLRQLSRRGCVPVLLGVITCGAFGCVKKPSMHLNHAEISGVQLATLPPSLGLLMTVVVDVYNPNGYDVAIRAMRGQVTLAEKYTLPIDFQPPGDGVWLASGTTTSVRTPVNMPVDLALLLLREAAMAPAITYRVTGKADVTGTRTFKIEEDDYSVDERGSISPQQIAAMIPQPFFLPH
jgi:hypothetical protein